MNRWPVRIRILFLSLAACAAVARAQDDEKNFRILAAATFVEPMDDSRAVLGGRTATIEAQGATGWEAGLEWRFSRSLGIEVGYGRTSHDLEFGGERLGQVRFEPVTAALDIHLLRTGAGDFWVAPTVVWLRWTADGLGRGVRLDEGRDPQLGATLGFDWSFDETWALTTAVRYVDAQIEFGGGGKAAVDPLSVRLGVAARF